MAERRRKKLKSLAKIIGRRVSRRPDAQYGEFCLPRELLELIFSQLTLRDNIRVSAVCRSWQAAAISVRKADKLPWLMSRPKSGDFYEFYDPSQRKLYYLELPELRGSRICYSKDGWLLLYMPRTRLILLFCPYTQDLIKLPELQLGDHIATFSAPPTSPSCIIFTVKRINTTVVAVRTCRPGATEWTTIYYQNHMPFDSDIWNIAFCKGCFCCLNLNGWLAVYNPETRTLRYPKCMYNLPIESRWKGRFMAEHNGDIFVVCTCSSAPQPFIYKLEQKNGMWVEVKSLGGVTFFAYSTSSVARSDLLGKMSGNVYFSKVMFYGKRCVTYSPGNGRYFPRKEGYDWSKQDPFENVWIEPPEDLYAFFKGGS